MVCLACLLPLFLVPIVNFLPILFFYIMGKIYRLMGWEYRKPEIVPPACPYKPVANKSKSVGVEHEPGTTGPLTNSVGADDDTYNKPPPENRKSRCIFLS